MVSEEIRPERDSVCLMLQWWRVPVFAVFFFVGKSPGETIYGENENLHPVFIFGTMKRGEPMHHWLENKNNCVCEFVTEAQTVQKFPMVIATKYHVPIVLFRPDEGHVIQGELYKMNLPLIKKLEKYEYLPHEIIGRIETVTYNISKTNEIRKCPAIMFVKYYLEDDSWLELPFISDYHSKGDHGLEFRERPVKKKKQKKKMKSRKHKKKDSDRSEGDIARMKRRMERSYNRALREEAALNRSLSTTTEYFITETTLSS